MSPFIMYSSQNPWNFLDMEVIMINRFNNRFIMNYNRLY